MIRPARWLVAGLVTLLSSGSWLGAVEAEVRLAAPTVWKDVRHHPLGMQAPTVTRDLQRDAKAMAGLGIRYLRWGDSRYWLWSKPPYQTRTRIVLEHGPAAFPSNDRTVVAADGLHVLPGVGGPDFTDLLGLAATIGAEPLIITAYNTLHRPSGPGSTNLPRETYLAAAEAQVRHALAHRPGGIRYWELGNEVWNVEEGGDHLTAERVRDDLREFTPRLKRIDPRIRMLVSGNRRSWFATVLGAADHIDYLNLSWYLWDVRAGFERIRTTARLLDESESFRGAVEALDALPHGAGARIGIIVTEFNALDWSKAGWPNRNDLGHALCVAQMAGEALAHPRIHLACYWSARWGWPLTTHEGDDTSINQALRNDGTPTATGLAVGLWGNHLLAELATLDLPDPTVRAWATRAAPEGELRLIVLNKDGRERPFSAPLAEGRRLLGRAVLAGQKLLDLRPTVRPEAPSLRPLAAHSVTVLRFGPVVAQP